MNWNTASQTTPVHGTPSCPADPSGPDLLHRIDAYIDRNLSDPQLSPRTVAADHHVSLRMLYALFDARDMSVAASIRRRRLERCRADLARSPLPVHVIAARWGFTSSTVFSRAFREVYGTSPTAFRRAMYDGARGVGGHSASWV
ncbi:helix-turn-helix domain-containing protein [Streptomyces uncialis]|uniref:HTH araC/xylS-type domain-containing protein n=1 Tax=Streptomyces uncialis TaxID=1048205 RepID=A0A1Q4V2U8_9ACTN|nr:helix-turn-helix domain-containing protein [Streptomyces uncialis]MCX4657940.1 helix-turn-helix domain-containing protein [Streptomyces uncialis]OKH92146.1 hypothetical protein AB852_24630 [Streptomyces uncialis]